MRRDHGDVPVLKALTGALGAAMWFNCILVLTHGAAAPPDNNAGQMTYEVYANQRTHGLQQAIRRGIPPSLLSPCMRCFWGGWHGRVYGIGGPFPVVHLENLAAQQFSHWDIDRCRKEYDERAQCFNVRQLCGRFAAGDTRLLNPVAPAENHANCRRNAAGEPVLPNGQPWKQQLLLLCLSSKILSDADSLLKISASHTGALPEGHLPHHPMAASCCLLWARGTALGWSCSEALQC